MTDAGTPGLVYKDRHGNVKVDVYSTDIIYLYSGDADWYGAGGIPGGRAVELFKPEAFPLDTLPALVPRSTAPFSDSALESTKKVSLNSEPQLDQPKWTVAS